MFPDKLVKINHKKEKIKVTETEEKETKKAKERRVSKGNI